MTAPSDPTEPGVPQGNLTIDEVVDDFARKGFEASLTPLEGGRVRDPASGAEVDAAELQVHEYRRLEGASDPADMSLVAAVSLPGGARGALVVGYGPNAGPADGDVLLRLRGI